MLRFSPGQAQGGALWMLATLPVETQEAELLKIGEKVRVKIEMNRGKDIKGAYGWGEGIQSFLCGTQPTVMHLIVFLRKHVQVLTL